MLSKKIESALNEQINAEFFSAYLYLSMSAYFKSMSLMGFANWTYLQYQEEIAHGMRFFEHIIDRGGKVVLDKIEKPKASWTSSVNVFEEIYAHEQKVTGLIHGLVALADKEKDYATHNMLQWFVAEQVEEEASAGEILDKIKLAKDAPGAMFALDGQLAERKAG